MNETKMWRSNDWETKKQEWFRKSARSNLIDGFVYEAGADAILKSLKERTAAPLILEYHGETIIINPIVMVRGAPGFIVFIPDKHDPDTLEGIKQLAMESMDRIIREDQDEAQGGSTPTASTG